VGEVVQEQHAVVRECSQMYLEAPVAVPEDPAPSYDSRVRLRHATDADDDFCYRLNLAAMREYIEPIYGWDVEDQRSYHNQWFRANRGSISIIEDDEGAAIGALDLSDEGDHIYLSRIAILPEVQGRGVGTAVIDDLIGRGRTIRLHVFINNGRARRFYERLGFVVDHDSEREHHLSMRRFPEARGA
jgi:ribosomal protein S18 acetylase RimI-like enzyme